MSWIVKYVTNEWPDKPHDGYMVINEEDDNSNVYGYHPDGIEQAKRFAKFANEFGEETACKMMNYVYRKI